MSEDGECVDAVGGSCECCDLYSARVARASRKEQDEGSARESDRKPQARPFTAPATTADAC